MDVNGDDSNSSIQFTVEASDFPQTIFNGEYSLLNGHTQDEYQPHIVIVEQPQQRGFRFRYECEGPSHGGLQGEKSKKSDKTYPAIRVENYSGPVRVVVTLVTDETVPKHHAHKLVGKNCSNGICAFDTEVSNKNIVLSNLSVLHVTRKKASEVLESRIMESMLLDKRVKLGDLQAELYLTDSEKQSARKQAVQQAKNMALNVVRLCFQVYLVDEHKQYTRLLPSVISNPIYDSKAPGASALKICRMDKYGGCCTGNEEVFLLCEKVQKDDIIVRFVEYDNSGDVVWEANGNFGPLDVHRQYAIVFQTPKYRDLNIEKAVNVMIMLQRKSDGEVSEPKAFTYYPQNLDKDGIARKKRKIIPPLDGFPSPYHGGGFGGMGGGGGGGGEGGNNGFGRGGRTHKLILPNGNIVSQKGNVPEMVEQAIDDVFNENPQDYNPAEDYERICRDLDVDSEPFTDPLPVTQQEVFIHSQKGRNASKEHIIEAFNKLSVDETEQKRRNKPEPSKSVLTQECVKEDTRKKMASASAREISTESTVRKVASALPKDLEFRIERQAESAKTDEGFSETSETSSTRGDMSPQNKGGHHTLPQVTAPLAMKTTKQMEAVHIAQRTTAALRDYSETGDIRYLLLVQRHLACISNENGDLPLHLAVINNQASALQCLLDVILTLPNSREKVNAYNHLRQTPLHLAVLTGQSNAIEMLLHAGADPSLADRNGNTPAHLAVINGSHQCLMSLVKYLRPGIKANKPFPELDYLNYDGYTPAHLAAQEGRVDMLRTLVYGQANINLADGKSGRSPLHHAVEVDDLVTAGYLLMETDTDVNSRCFDGNTALHIACGRNLVGMVALLMTAGADPEIENEEIPSDESDDDADEEEHSGGSWNRRGLTPADYVQNNDRIMRVLEGDVYESNTSANFAAANNDLDEDSVPSKWTHLTTHSHQESGLGSLNIKPLQQVGDLEKLDFPTRIELSQLLDPENDGKDVFTLADKLGFSSFQTTLEGMENSSPTRFLFDFYEASDGTVSHLKKCLMEMKRQDAVDIIDKAVKGGKLSLECSQVDSGVGSLTGKSLPTLN